MTKELLITSPDAEFMQYLEELGRTMLKKELAETLGISYNYLNAFQNGTRDLTIQVKRKILEHKNNTQKTHYEQKPLSLVAEEKPDYHIMYVPMINHYAYAGYLDGYYDSEYVRELPTYPIVKEQEYKGMYRVFEVKGDSMDDGTDRSIKEYDKILCRNIQKHHWQNKLHISQYLFVIVHKEEGIVLKQIKEHNVENGIITLSSFNSFYEDYQIQLDDVLQLFNVIEIVSRKPKV